VFQVVYPVVSGSDGLSLGEIHIGKSVRGFAAIPFIHVRTFDIGHAGDEIALNIEFSIAGDYPCADEWGQLRE
jgi:hypothetical protein